jgi:ribosomal protein L11 methyltransferase
MNWQRVHIDLHQIDPAPVEHALLELGAVSIDFSDAADDPILEPAPGTMPLWPSLRLSALFEAEIEATAIRLAVATAIETGPMPTLSFELVADQNWIKNWQQALQPMQFGQNLWICPSGSACPEPGGTVIKLDPGLAFGTGSHPTTALCLDWLADNTDPDCSVLDYGCGSGILSIAALVLGANQVLGVDFDSQALHATHENAVKNQVAERLTILPPEAVNHEQKFELIVANILSGTLIELAPELRSFCRTGTRIALSGILTGQIESVTTAYNAWVQFDPPVERDDWALLSGTVITA